MHAIEAARKAPASIAGERPITEAAALMDLMAVGALVVVETDGRPVGIVTDRDLVVRAMARGLSLHARVDTVMSIDLVTMPPDADLREAFRIFDEHAIRRLPLVAGDRLVGMLTVDNLVVDAVADLVRLVRPVTGQVLFGHPEPSPPAVAS